MKSKKKLPNASEMGITGGQRKYEKYGPEAYSEMGKKGHEGKLRKYGPEYYKNLSAKGVEARRIKKEKAEKEKNSSVTKITDLLTGK